MAAASIPIPVFHCVLIMNEHPDLSFSLSITHTASTHFYSHKSFQAPETSPQLGKDQDYSTTLQKKPKKTQLMLVWSPRVVGGLHVCQLYADAGGAPKWQMRLFLSLGCPHRLLYSRGIVCVFIGEGGGVWGKGGLQCEWGANKHRAASRWWDWAHGKQREKKKKRAVET